MKSFPKQRLSFKDKIKSDYKWAKDTIDHLLLNFSLDSTIVNTYHTDYHRKLSNYQLYNNQLNQADFARECNPLGLDVGQFADEIQPYNKTYNKIQVLLGEELRRPFNFRTILVNSEGVRSKLAHRDALIRQFVEAQVQRTIQQLTNIYPPEQLEEASTTTLDPTQIDLYMKSSYLDSKERLSAQILRYLYRQLDVKDKQNDGFKHACIAGEEIVYVSAFNSEPVLEIVNPLGFFSHKSPETKWIQDGLYAGYRTYMSPAQVLDRYGDYMTEEERKKIDTTTVAPTGITNDAISGKHSYGHEYQDKNLTTTPYFEGSYSPSSIEDWLVEHVEWRSQRKVGFLTISPLEDEPTTTIVSEDYEVPPTATKRAETKEYNRKVQLLEWQDELGTTYSLSWSYVPEVWQGTRIGRSIYVMVGPKEEQFRPLDNPYEVKLGYHGIVYNAMNASSISLMDRMKPFAYLYFIVMHKLKKLIAQDQGKVFPFDVSMVDPKMGLEKTLYYLKELNIDFYNPLQNSQEPGLNQRGKVTTAIDLSNMQHIMNYVQLLSALDQQLSEVAGVTRQREGQILPTEAVTNAASNAQMSSVITQIYFAAHDKLWEKVLTSLVQVAKQTWKDRAVAKQFVLDDLSTLTLQLSPDDLKDADIGVFIADSGKEVEMFDALKGMADGLLNTNRATFSDLIRMYKASSSEELQNLIENSEQKMRQQEQQLQQQQLEAQQQMQQSEQAFELEKQQREIDKDITVAEIGSFRFLQDQDSNNNQVPDQLEIERLRNDKEYKDKKLALEEKALDIKARQTPKSK